MSNDELLVEILTLAADLLATEQTVYSPVLDAITRLGVSMNTQEREDLIYEVYPDQDRRDEYSGDERMQLILEARDRAAMRITR